MYQSVYEEYLDSEVLTAEPIKLVQLMYRGALDAIGGARKALTAGDIPTRSRLISKASAILNELALSLDHSVSPELCRNLVELYDYMLRCLIESNTKQIEPPLIEVERLLGDILTAWQQAAPKEQAATPVNARTAYAGDSHPEYQPVSVAC